MLLEIAAGNDDAPQNVIFATGQHMLHPADDFQIFLNRLIDIVEVVPDARIFRVALPQRFNITASCRRRETLGQRQYAVFRIGHSVLPDATHGTSRYPPASVTSISAFDGSFSIFCRKR